MIKKCWATFLIFIIFCAPVAAGDNTGTSAAAFLKIPADSFSQALGGYNYAYPKYASTIFSNPALMSSIGYAAFSIDASRWIAQSHSGSFSFVAPVNKKKTTLTPGRVKNKRTLSADKKKPAQSTEGGSFGFGVLYFSPGDIYETQLGPGYEVIETGNKLDAKDFCAVAGYSRNFNYFNAGLNLKFIQSVLDKHTARAYAADVGFSREFAPEAGRLYLGLVVQNLGTKLDYISDTSHKDDLPVIYGLALGYEIEKTVALINLSKPADNDPVLAAGISYEAVKDFCLRLGYKLLDGNKSYIGGSMTGFSMGLSFPLAALGGDIGYSYAPYNKFGSSHHITFNFSFGRGDEFDE